MEKEKISRLIDFRLMLAKYYLLEEITSNLAALAVAQALSLSSIILIFPFLLSRFVSLFVQLVCLVAQSILSKFFPHMLKLEKRNLQKKLKRLRIQMRIMTSETSNISRGQTRRVSNKFVELVKSVSILNDFINR